MEFFSGWFLFSIVVGLYAAFLIVERLSLKVAAVIAGRSLPADSYFNLKMLTWLSCSTYNCWYLFVKGL